MFEQRLRALGQQFQGHLGRSGKHSQVENTSAEALVGKFSAFKGERKDKPGEGEF